MLSTASLDALCGLPGAAGVPRRPRSTAFRPRATRACRARSRSRPRSCRGGGRCRRRRAAASRRARRTSPSARDRSRRRPRESSRACAGSSARRARTGSLRGRAARAARARRSPAVPTPRRDTRCSAGRSSPSSGPAVGQTTSTLTIPSSTWTGKVLTDSTAGRVSARPVRMSMFAPCRGQIGDAVVAVEVAFGTAARRRGSSGPRARSTRRSGCRRRSRARPA